jgi:hypothetical protein
VSWLYDSSTILVYMGHFFAHIFSASCAGQTVGHRLVARYS